MSVFLPADQEQTVPLSVVFLTRSTYAPLDQKGMSLFYLANDSAFARRDLLEKSERETIKCSNRI